MKTTSTSSHNYLVALSFVIMIVTNALASLLPLNDMTTGEISDLYHNLFAPAGITFSVWGLIYFMLGCYVLLQLGIIANKDRKLSIEDGDRISMLFVISSFANAVWIFTWHYQLILFSMALMIIILLCLMKISNELKNLTLSKKEHYFLRLPFSIYYGWITVATIANATVLLVSLNWDGFGISEPIWTVVVLIVGLVLGVLTMVSNKDLPYGLVLIWAYLGIIIRHISPDDFAGEHLEVIIAATASIVLFVLSGIYLIRSKTAR